MIYYLLFLLLAAAFILRVLANTLNFTWLWQIKEYRLDRLFVHLKETNEGRHFLINRSSVLFWLLFLSIPLSYFDSTKVFFLIAATIIFVIDGIFILGQLKKRLLRRPVLTVRIIIIIFITVITIIVLLFSLPFPKAASLVFVDRLIFAIVSLSVLTTSLLTFFVKIFLVESAKRKIKSMKNLMVIGVTGSFGKSLTKELIAALLAEKYKVLKTPRSVNTDLAIARLILSSLTAEHEIFVVEMGAYKRGEIAAICDMVKPKIGVLTGINEQHLSLFGSLENTKKAKFELMEALPKDGLAVVNGDDINASSLIKEITIKTRIYNRPAENLGLLARGGKLRLKREFIYANKNTSGFQRTNLNLTEKTADFQSAEVYKSTDIKVKAGPFAANLAGAAAVAESLDVIKEKIKNGIKNSLSSLGLKILQKGTTAIIDDSFNSNPAGFNLALSTLKTFGGRKILVTAGIIELGVESYNIHKQLGQKIGTICDVVILTSDNFAKPIQEGLINTKFNMKNFFVPKREDLTDIVKKNIQGKTVILLEGRVPVEV